jgi:hypothetical protein
MGIKTPSIGHWQGVEFMPHSVSSRIIDSRSTEYMQGSDVEYILNTLFHLGIYWEYKSWRNESLQVS